MQRMLTRIARRFAEAPKGRPGMSNESNMIVPPAAQPLTPAMIVEKFHRSKLKDEKEHRIIMMEDLILKRVDEKNYDQNLISRQKVILEAVRMRHDLDSFNHLRTTDHVACTIAPRGPHEGIDFVIHKSQVRALRKLRHLDQRPIYVKLPEGEEIRCLMRDIFLAPDQQVYFKVTFDRYIVGQPNRIRVRLEMKQMPHLAMKSDAPNLIHESIDLISYNDANPTEIHIDFNRLMRKRRYTLGDLANTLPPGLEIHPKYKSWEYPLVSLEDAGPGALGLDDFFHDDEIFETFLAKEEETQEAKELDSERDIEDNIAIERAKKNAIRQRLRDEKAATRDGPQPTLSLKKKIAAETEIFRSKIAEASQNLDESFEKERVDEMQKTKTARQIPSMIGIKQKNENILFIKKKAKETKKREAGEEEEQERDD